MPITESGVPKINILFIGFFISRIKNGDSVAEIGALANSDCHRPRVSVFRNENNGFPQLPVSVTFDIDQNIEFKVHDTDLNQIKEFKKEPFNRTADTGDINDFRWVLDLNNEVLNGEKVPILADKLRPIFRINNAEFHSVRRTNALRKRRPNAEPEPFGRIADIFGANVYFKADSKMVIKNGIDEVMTIDNSEPNTTYQIVIDCHCQQELATSDFPEVFKVLGNVPGSVLGTDFVPEPPAQGVGGGPIQGGDVPCMGGNISK